MADALAVHVRLARAEEIPVFGRWARTEQWNPGDGDAEIFAVGAPNGFYVAAIDAEAAAARAHEPGYDEQGEGAFDSRHIVGLVARTDHSATYVFCGYFIVRPGWREHGVGHKLAEALGLTGTATVGLDGVPAQVDRYHRWGAFDVACRVVRHNGHLPPRQHAHVATARIVPAQQVPLDDLVALERVTFGCTHANRSAFLKHWISRPQPGAAALCLLAADGTSVVGFAACRPAATGVRVGPLVAPNASDAEDLFYALAAATGAVPAPEFFIDVPDSHADAIALAQRLGLKPGFACSRMYSHPEHGGGPALTATVFGTLSLETGP